VEDEMGGSGGGGPTSIDLSKLTQAAEERLKQLAKTRTKILFACEKEDRKALDSHLARSKVFSPKDITVVDSGQKTEALNAIDGCSIIIVFTDSVQKADFLDQIIESSLVKKKQGIHVKAKDKSLIPSKALAYRWPSLDWEKLETMFKD
jgi:hypothetical protein